MSTATDTVEKIKVKLPSRYNVIMHNDDSTVMEFVVMVLMEIFNHPESAAEKIMMSIHTDGASIVGNFTREVAELKVEDTMQFAKHAGFPNFKLTMESD